MGVINTHGDLTPTGQYEWNYPAIRIRHLILVITSTSLINLYHLFELHPSLFHRINSCEQHNTTQHNKTQREGNKIE